MKLTKEEMAQLKADAIVEFIREYGKLPRGTDTYKGFKVGRFLDGARQMKSKLAIDALKERGVDFSVNSRSYQKQLNLKTLIDND